MIKCLNIIVLQCVLKKYINKIEVYETGDYYIYIDYIYIKIISRYLNRSLIFKYNALVDLVGVDMLGVYPFKNFMLYYNLISYYYNFRIFIVLSFFLKNIYIYSTIESLCDVYYSSNWLEREIWDMLGIYFYNHYDFRRILTDYGFKGFPLRKTFPLNGYKEIRYNIKTNLLIYENLIFMQSFRSFRVMNTWTC